MSRLIPLLIALVTGTCAVIGPASAAPAGKPVPAAVFEIELVDTSGESSSQAQKERIEATTAALREKLIETGYFQPVDLAPASDRIAGFKSCEQCLLGVAKDMGAEVAVLGKVNKISTLILSMDITVRDVSDGKVTARGTADIRGDNDRSWLRGMEWLIQHRIVPQENRAPR
jgi:hypothetical protein